MGIGLLEKKLKSFLGSVDMCENFIKIGRQTKKSENFQKIFFEKFLGSIDMCENFIKIGRQTKKSEN